MNLKWGNQCISSRWNHIFSGRLFSNTTLGYTRFSHQNSLSTVLTEKNTLKKAGDLGKELSSGIFDFLTKTDFDFSPGNGHQIKFGGGLTYHTYDPSVQKYNQTGGSLTPIDILLRSPIIRALETEAYAEDEFRTGSFTFNLGLHAADFFVDNVHYPSLQPRLRGDFRISPNMSVQASYTRMVQAIHLLSNSDAGLPTDLWVPSTGGIPPQKSDLFVVGWTCNPDKDHLLDLTIEGYYKSMKNLIEFGEGESFFTTGKDWQEKIVKNGSGVAYGIEFLLQKKEGNTTGWIGYTWSKNTRRFDQLNRGEPFPYRFDRRHVFTIVINHQINEKWSFSGNWVYSTGEAISLALSKYPVSVLDTEPDFSTTLPDPFTDQAFIYDKKNNYRMPAYHRLDIGFHYKESNGRKSRTWSFEIYNAYNRKNPYYLYFNKNDKDQMKLYSFSLFPIIPSISFKTEW